MVRVLGHPIATPQLLRNSLPLVNEVGHETKEFGRALEGVFLVPLCEPFRSEFLSLVSEQAG